jgi:hypothetical protein
MNVVGQTFTQKRGNKDQVEKIVVDEEINPLE